MDQNATTTEPSNPANIAHHADEVIWRDVFPTDDEFLSLARLWPQLRKATKGAIVALARHGIQ